MKNKVQKMIFLAALLTPIGLVAQLKIGTKAPELNLERIYHKKDNVIPTLETLKGKVVILDFWATWCSPCVAAFPENNRMYNKYKSKDVAFIAITDDGKEALENFLKKMKVDFCIAQDANGDDFKNYKVPVRPQAYIINRAGVIVFEGYSITEDILNEVLETNTFKQKKVHEYSVITAGGFSPGEDPLYNGMRRMLDLKSKDKPDLIEQFIIRSSLEKSRHGRGSYVNKNDYVGITINGYPINFVYSYTLELSSPLWIKNKTNHKDLYDVIYWKKAKDIKATYREKLEAAYKEINNSLEKGLSIKLVPVTEEKQVAILSMDKKTQYLKYGKEIKEGTDKLHKNINSFISTLEKKSNQLYMFDKSLKDRYVETGVVSLYELNVEEIIKLLNSKGIIVKQEKRKVTLYEIRDS